MKIETTIELITPEMAQKYLDTRPPWQRNVRPGWVSSLARMIKEGSFLLTHQGIAFNENGSNTDGQHRLLAIIEAGIPVKMMVTRGLSDNAWKGTDQGVVRRVHEVTSLNKRLGEAVRFVTRFVYFEQKPSSESLEFIGSSTLGKKIHDFQTHAPTIIRYFSQSPLVVVAAIRACLDGGDYALNQYRALTLQDYDAMSQISKSLCRQVSTNKANHDIKDTVCRAWKVFDPSRMDTTKIQINDIEIKPIYAAIRFHAETLIGKCSP